MSNIAKIHIYDLEQFLNSVFFDSNNHAIVSTKQIYKNSHKAYSFIINSLPSNGDVSNIADSSVSTDQVPCDSIPAEVQFLQHETLYG